MIGDYSHLVHLETLIETRRSGSTAFGIVADGAPIAVEDELHGMTTVLDALRERFAEREVDYVAATARRDMSDAAIKRAADAAADADVAIVISAERSGLTDDSTNGEFRDRQELGLSGRQQQLLEAVVATGTPVVLVVISGRPLVLEWAARHCAAILLAWAPGQAGPQAIAEVVAGDCEPGGRLPVTLPRSVGQVPLTYRHHPTGGRSNPKGDHVDGPSAPLWPFGFGLSYTSFELSNLRLDRDVLDTVGGELRVTVDVTNTGTRPGEEVVQLYVRDQQASVARPVLELLGFRRLALVPGERCSVEFTLHAEQFAYTGADCRRVVEPGGISLHVGRSSADLPFERRDRAGRRNRRAARPAPLPDRHAGQLKRSAAAVSGARPRAVPATSRSRRAARPWPSPRRLPGPLPRPADGSAHDHEFSRESSRRAVRSSWMGVTAMRLLTTASKSVPGSASPDGGGPPIQ